MAAKSIKSASGIQARCECAGGPRVFARCPQFAEDRVCGIGPVGNAVAVFFAQDQVGLEQLIQLVLQRAGADAGEASEISRKL